MLMSACSTVILAVRAVLNAWFMPQGNLGFWLAAHAVSLSGL